MLHVPPGLTEAEVLKLILDLARELSPRLSFPGMPSDDLAQEMFLMCQEALPRFDNRLVDGRPHLALYRFLKDHCRRRTVNLKRNLYHRTDVPCVAYGQNEPHEPTELCRRHERWRTTNAKKAALFRAAAAEEEPAERVDPVDFTEDVALREVLTRIDDRLPVELRAAYLRLRAGQSVPTALRREVEEAVREILEGAGIEVSPPAGRTVGR
jgi:hypothetical protein